MGYAALGGGRVGVAWRGRAVCCGAEDGTCGGRCRTGARGARQTTASCDGPLCGNGTAGALRNRRLLWQRRDWCGGMKSARALAC